MQLRRFNNGEGVWIPLRCEPNEPNPVSLKISLQCTEYTNGCGIQQQQQRLINGHRSSVSFSDRRPPGARCQPRGPRQSGDGSEIHRKRRELFVFEIGELKGRINAGSRFDPSLVVVWEAELSSRSQSDEFVRLVKSRMNTELCFVIK